MRKATTHILPKSIINRDHTRPSACFDKGLDLTPEQMISPLVHLQTLHNGVPIVLLVI